MPVASNTFTLDDMIQGFFEHKIVEINIKNPFLLASGRTSPVYLDHRKIFSHPKLRTGVLQLWSRTLLSYLPPNCDPSTVAIVGTATAGIAPAFGLSTLWNCAFAYVRSQSKGHGLKNTIEGVIPAGAPVIVVEDMVTTGGSVLKACNDVRAAGGNLLFATCISQHRRTETDVLFIENKLSLVNLIKTDLLFEGAQRMNIISTEEAQVVARWLAELQAS